MNVPHTWQTPAARSLYASELERLGRFLVRLGGEVPSQDHLVQTILEFEEQRNRLRELRWKMQPKEYSQAVIDWHRTGELPDFGVADRFVPKGVPVVIVGGPLMESDRKLFDMIEKFGGYVALDATEAGERMLPSYDLDRLKSDPVSAITDAYLAGIQDPFRRPDDGLFDWLRDKVSERGVRAVILHRFIWCDNWHAEAERIRDTLGLPFLHLDVSGDGADDARTATRLGALMEMLR
jgi:hypothetical protein